MKNTNSIYFYKLSIQFHFTPLIPYACIDFLTLFHLIIRSIMYYSKELHLITLLHEQFLYISAQQTERSSRNRTRDMISTLFAKGFLGERKVFISSCQTGENNLGILAFFVTVTTTAP